MTTNPELDPYTSKAENQDITPQHKIDGLKEIISNATTGMLTTRARDGNLYSRAMTPVSACKHGSPLHFIFIGNNVSGKFDEIEHDPHVNISFYDPSSTNWASISGQAHVSRDKQLIKEHWSSMLAGYFGDLGDGVHKGDENDPRVSVIKVVPNEIRYWMANKGKVGQKLQVAMGAVTGKAQAPGEIRTITPAEIKLVEGLHKK